MTIPLSYKGKHWSLPEKTPANAIFVASEFREAILTQRGIVEPAAQALYLQPKLSQLPEPLLLADMEAAVSRLVSAIKQKQLIAIYGDYDVDGVCSATLLVDFLRQVQANVCYYIPDRMREGYGLNAEAVQTICQTANVLITTDCGITSHHEITIAKNLGVDVIVCDHHQVPEKLPPSFANLNPHRLDCNYPFKDLCATGVAYVLAIALRRALRDDHYFHNIRDLCTARAHGGKSFVTRSI